MATSVLRLPSLSKKLGLSRSTIYDKLNPRSPRHDPSFPQPIHLGNRAVGWLEHEIDGWVTSQTTLTRS